MAAPVREDNALEQTGKRIAIGARMPMTPPVSLDDVCTEIVDSQVTPPLGSLLLERGLDQSAQGSATTSADEQSKTLELAQQPFVHKNGKLDLSQIVQNQVSEQTSDHGETQTLHKDNDYFASQRSENSNAIDFAPIGTSQTSKTSSLPGVSRAISTPASSNSQPGTRMDFTSQSKVGPLRSAGATRPTSVPNSHSKPFSRRREGPDYPNYPNQSFQALQDQVYPTPYRSNSPRPLRTRSSHISQSSSFSSMDNQTPRDSTQVSSGAKTVGNTPAQSPSLFSPMYPSKRQWPGDSDDGRSSTPMLHPTYHKPPKETHKLLKDYDPISGRKTINHYECFHKLGSGQHGTVKQGRNIDTGELVAIKIVRRFSKKLRLGRSGDPNDMIKKEVAILKKARHPHVVSLIEVIDDDEFGKVYLVLEYVERGEIIWRKQTDKDIASFETARIKREIANDIDEKFETTSVAQFNIGAPARRIEKKRLLERQKRQARRQFGIDGGDPSERPPHDFWSLEFADDADLEAFLDSRHRPDIEREAIMLPSDNSRNLTSGESPPTSESSSHTPKPPPRPDDLTSAPTSLPPSRPDTPANLEGTMHGPYVNEALPDTTLQSTLNDIIAGQTKWSPDEEDFRYVPCLTQPQALDAFRDTVLGLEYLHYQGIIHRDIKPANLLWTNDYRVKISDFGVSYLGKPIREDDNKQEIPEADADILDEAIELAKTVGTPAFYAPELCDPHYFETEGHPERPAITGQIDVWALGVTLYGMIFGRLPFYHPNEFQMYERIAREEVFIPRKRLKGVEHTDKTPSNTNKRLDDVLDYEDVDDELRDLLKRLLDKQPSKRITLKEVKHHPWVLRGISDHMSWMDETDPSLQSQGRKIEVSTQEVQDAVIGLTLVDRFKAGFQRVGSVLRGRNARKRADSLPKPPEPKPVDPAHVPAPVYELEKVQPVITNAKRLSLRGDEQIYTALRASRGYIEHIEHTEHPLAQSVAASPENRNNFAYFDEEKPPRPVSDPQASRPSFPDRTLSTADSMKTIRAPVSASYRGTSPTNTSFSSEDFSTATAIPDPNPDPSSSLGSIFGGGGRRFVNSMRSRERGNGPESPSQSSRSSSLDRDVEDPHASPSLALSSAVAAGHLNQPPALQQEQEMSHHLKQEPTFESLQRDEKSSRRQTFGYQNHARRPTVSLAAEVACPPSPDDELFSLHQRPVSSADSTSAFQISSSSDRIVSGDSTPHSRIPSVISGASSLSATVEGFEDSHPFYLDKSASPLNVSRFSESGMGHRRSDEALNTKPALAPAAVEEEAGYNGEGEQDSDSEDEGLAMA